ncbi:MAG: helix-turn-helix transcriptional regulator [Candidatus Pacebacteria bacterium]|jgi:ribosome-binding protein aMBF1 (putative translation factor)|nr:helix-turn-helix transcriptional regulator [Candidatus Paceibacterota bacterium]MBT3512025.1 helix-turn-helix transcriptional regulator [Candidatus Paceibacterota bacterium]MBT4004877.1 helix-turn-helix transcriptional regulator [Candidatus Paceibacterota bacterium]MBT4359056.1 helix-turn-helix transcriptional regulator [Candidatus Paceibacterota bacterium]MBT4680543.1 helix-turn-helix transcriptional regulator [Candidatus Paceibacterota bacterium]
MKINLKKLYPWEDHKKELRKDPEHRRLLKEFRPEYEAAKAMIEARIKHNLTQKELALKMDTKQSVISRVENMQTTPSLSFLKRFASVFGGRVSLKFSGI